MGAIEVVQSTCLALIGLVVGKEAQLEVGKPARSARCIEVLRPSIAAEKLQTMGETLSYAGLK